MSSKFTPIAAAVALALGSASASAVDFSLRGYGTFGVAHSDNDQADYVHGGFLQSEGVGYSEDYSFGLDSKAALQLDARFNDRWSAVVQIITQDQYGNSWDNESVVDEFTPSLEWANVSFKATDSLTLRAGRVVLPFLMLSDSQRVTYANHWLRAPVETYGELPFFTSDGGDVSYNKQVGKAFNTFRAHYGVQEQVREGGTNDVTLWGFNDTVEFGQLLVRAAYLNVKFEQTSQDLTNLFMGFAGLANALGQVEAAQEAIRLQQIYDVAEEQEVELINVGFSYDANSWFMMGELNHVESDGVQVGSLGGYISGGVRRGAFTPFITLSRAKSTDRNEDLIDVASLAALNGAPPPPGVPPLQYYGMVNAAVGMASGINGFVGGVTANNGQTTTAVGVRWDFARNFALKFQYDHIDLDEGSTGRFINVQPGFEPGGTVGLYSLAVDFVF